MVEKEKQDFARSFCQSTTHYLNMADLHDFLAAIIKMCFIGNAPQSTRPKMESKTNALQT